MLIILFELVCVVSTTFLNNLYLGGLPGPLKKQNLFLSTVVCCIVYHLDVLVFS